MYSYKFWDYKSSINGCKAENTGFIGQSEVYLINDDKGHTVQIQTEKDRPYKELTVAESAAKQVEDMNAAEEYALNNPPQQESEVTE